MRRQPQRGPATLASAAIVVAIGSAADACSGELRSGEGASDASGDQSALQESIDAGVPDAAVDQWQPSGVAYGPMTCTEDSECPPGLRCDTSQGDGVCVAAAILGSDAQVAPAARDALDASVESDMRDASVDAAAPDASLDREPVDAISDRDALRIDDGSPDARVTYDSACTGIFYGPAQCTSDRTCVELYGSGYWCDTDAGVTDSCGRFLSWPQCLPGSFASDAAADATTTLDSGSGESSASDAATDATTPLDSGSGEE